MKVALVHSYYSSAQPSGENVVVDAQAAALREHGLDVRVIAARTDALETRPHHKLRTAIDVATGGGASPLAELEDFDPDLVHVHNLFPNWGVGWLDRWRGPLVATVHNFRPVCSSGILFRDGAACTLCPDRGSLEAVRHACYRNSRLATLPLAIRSRRGVAGDHLLSRADRVILLSDRARGLYEGFGLPGEKTVVIPNFVEDIGFTPQTPPGTEWVYIGRLTREKGVANLLRHWPENEVLNIYGNGPLQDEVEAAARPNLRYHGRLDHDDIPRVLAGARGLVFPSECAEGGCPLSYVEALAGGRVVVARAGNGAADDLAVADCGTIFQSWDMLSEALSAASSKAQVAGLRGREHYEARFRREVFLARTTAVYGELISGHPKARHA